MAAKEKRAEQVGAWVHGAREWLSEQIGPAGNKDGRRTVTGLGADPRPPDPRLSLDLAGIGERASYFFLSDSTRYLRRHVETLQIKSAAYARRRLTVDVQLPGDPALGSPQADGTHLFWIPVTAITKRPPRSNIDFRDDRGAVVPLFTRAENSEISLAAALAAARQLLDREPSPLLSSLLAAIIRGEGGVSGEVPLVLARAALEAEGIRFDKDEHARAYSESLRILSGNSSVWVAFQGRPEERRVIKFHYDVEFERQGILRQRRATRSFLIFARQSRIAYELDLDERGDGNPYSPLRRLAARGASATALGAVNLGIKSPYIVGSDSYHLQVEAPPGVETRDIDLLASLKTGETESWEYAHAAHLYVSRAQLAQEGAGLALLTLRIGRRGFMTLSWLSALLSAVIIWLFYLTATKTIASPEATTTVLLFGPALLAALVVRPGEHPVATKLFSGVRILVALNGLLAVASAAAVVHVRPEGWSVEEAWLLYAVLASVCAGMVSLGWVFSWDTTYGLVKALRRQLSTASAYRLLCARLMILAVGVLVLGSLDSLSIRLPALYLVPLGALILACAFVAAGYAGLQRPSALLAAVGVTATFFASLIAFAVLLLRMTSAWSWEECWLFLALVPLAGVSALVVNDRRWKKKHAQDSGPAEGPQDLVDRGSAWLTEVDVPGLRWFRQTPTGERVRRRAREEATGIPDLLAPSAYHEVEPSEELIEEATPMYQILVDARRDLPAEIDDGATAEALALQRAKEGRREFVSLSI